MITSKKINKFGEYYKEVSFNEYEKQFDKKFDFDFLLPYSLGCSNLLHEKINDLYSRNKETYHYAYKHSIYFEDYRILSLSVLNQLATKRLIGIFATIDEKEKSEIILKFIKKAFKFIYQYVQKVKSIDIYEIRDNSLEYAKRNKLPVIFGSAHVFSITLYLCQILNKEINLEDNLTSVNLIQGSLRNIDDNETFESLKMKNIEKINRFKAQYSKFPLKKFDVLSLNHFITGLNHSYKWDKRHTVKTNEECNNLVINHDFQKGVSITATYLSLNNINVIDLQNITPIQYNDVSKILDLIFDMLGEETETITPGYLLGSFVILEALTRDYKKVKDQLLNTSIEDTLLEIHNLRQQYQTKIDSLQTIETDLLKKINIKTNIIDLQQLEINQLHKEKKLLHEEMENLKYQNLILNNTISEIQNINNTLDANFDIQNIDYQEMVNYLSNKKLILIGGDPKWHSQLSNVLPNLKYLNSNDLNKNLNYVSNYDAIFFNYKNNNHSMFYKIQNILKNSDTPLHYCGDFSNLNRNIKHFYSCLQKDIY